MNFCQIQNHKGKSIGRKTEKCLLSSGIFRVFTVIVDNASCNDISLSYLKVSMKDWNVHPLKGEYLHVRCCAHILHLIISDGLKETHDSVTRIRNVVRFVHSSPSCMDRFRTFIKDCRIQDNCTVQLDVPTRWNSTYLMLETALKFHRAFKRLGERDTKFAMMQGGIPLSKDWDNARVFVRFLKTFLGSH